MSITDKINALYAKAEGTDNEHEAEIFAAKAAELLAEHNLTRSDLGSPEEYGKKTTPFTIGGGPYGLTRVAMLNNIARVNGLFMVYNDRWVDGKRCYDADLFGHLPTIDMVLSLFTQLDTLGLRQMKKVKGSYNVSTVSARRSFLLGFISEVATRLEKANKAADEESDGCLLPALIDERTRAEQLARETYRHLRTNRSRGVYDQQSAAAGAAAGRTADIGGPRVGATRAQIGAGR